MKVIGYIRVSTTGQAEEGISLAGQRDRIHKWAELNEGEVIAIYEDAGLSGGSTANRPGLESALSAARKGDALVSYSISRLARSTRDMLDIADRLERQGADLVSLSEKIDTTSAAGRMIFRMLAVLAEFERDQVSERTRMALATLKSRGVKLGCPNPKAGALARHNKAVTLWRERYGLVLAQIGECSTRETADRLNSLGLKTPQGAVWTSSLASRLRKRIRGDI